MKKIILGKNGFLSSAIQRVIAPDEDIVVVGSKDFDLLKETPKVMPDVQGADVLIDCADYYPGISAASGESLSLYSINVAMFDAVFKLAEANDIKKVVTIGTTGCYPITDEPVTESMFDGNPAKLNQKLVGYALSRFTLLDIAALYKPLGIEHHHLILPNFYGPGDKYEVGRSHLLASWIRDFDIAKQQGKTSITLWGPPDQRREFIYIDDAARYVLRLSEADLNHEVINVGTETAPTYQELAAGVLRELDFPARLEWDTTRHLARHQEIMDTSRLKEYAALLPAPTGFAAGLSSMVQGYLNDKSR